MDPLIVELGKNAPWFLVSLVLFTFIIKTAKWLGVKMNDMYSTLFDKEDGKVVQLLEAQHAFVQSVKQNNDLLRVDILDALETIKSVEKKISYMNMVGFENMNSDYFDILFEQTPIPIAFVNGDSEIMRVNGRCCELFGYEMDEIVNLTTTDITCESDKKIGIAQAEMVKRGELSFYRVEKTFMRKNNTTVYCIVYAYRIPSEGPFNHYIEIIIPTEKGYQVH